MGPVLDLRPQLERLDRLICWSEGIDEGGLSFAFRPLWQLDEPAKAALALTRAQATQVYAGMKLWPDAVVARLAEAQLVADGAYPNAAAVFAEGMNNAEPSVLDAFPVRSSFDPDEPRDPDGKWARSGSGAPAPSEPESGSATARVGRSDIIRVAASIAPAATIQGESPATAGSAPYGTPLELVQQTCADYISQNCKASILRVFPGQYLDQPLDRVLSDAANGVKAAQTAKKLMFEKRFAK